jgi:hypothetical protein
MISAADGCCNTMGAAHGTYEGHGATTSGESGLPFTQLLLCFLAQPAPSYAAPYGTVAVFEADTPGCPSNWTALKAAAGRTLLPGAEGTAPTPSDAPPLASQEDRAHVHTLEASILPDPTSFAGVDGCCNDSPSAQTTYPVAGETAPASSNVPYIQLLTCASEQESFAVAMPKGALLWSAGLSCPDGWELATPAVGRFLVALPANGEPGASFGGKSVPPGTASPPHTHSFSGSVTLPATSIGLVSGCCADGYAAAGDAPFTGQSDNGATGFPYLQIALCQQQ